MLRFILARSFSPPGGVYVDKKEKKNVAVLAKLTDRRLD
jgi:hypothetical protein